MKKYHSITFICLITCTGVSGCGAAGAAQTETVPTDVTVTISETAFTEESSAETERTATDTVTTETVTFAQETTEEESPSEYYVSDRIKDLVSGPGYTEGESFIEGEPEISYEYTDEDFEYYSLEYAGGTFEVIHEYDNWKIFDSYKIRNSRDMEKICQSLIDIYPVHGRDLSSYRNAEDMTYEWVIHNIAYDILDDDDFYKQCAASVDLDPDEQNKTLLEIYSDRENIAK